MNPEISKLQDIIKQAKNEIDLIQSQCPHENIKVEKFTTDNDYSWDTEDWITVECPDCGYYRSFGKEGDKEEYLKFTK